MYGRHKLTDAHVAIKYINKSMTSEASYMRLKVEAGVLNNCRHPNIQDVIEFIENDEEASLITRYCHGADLQIHM